MKERQSVWSPDASGNPTCQLTIGLPVYNGERYVGQAIGSILKQTFRNFRLVVFDNASTDRTGAIVRQYVRDDPRVEYRRNQRNIGAAGNFNRAFGLCYSPYFKWAACDDELEPSYLARCIEALEADPTVVLAHSFVRQIDADGRPAAISPASYGEYAEPIADQSWPGSVYRPVAPATEASERRIRLRFYVLNRSWCTEIFGVIRASALRGTPLIASFANSDLALLAELALRGRFHTVPAPLFLNRDHADRFTRRLREVRSAHRDRHQVRRWFDTSKISSKYQMDWWIFFHNYFVMINRNVSSPVDRLILYREAFRWLTVRWYRSDLAKDLLYAVSPTLLERAELLHRWLAKRPPHQTDQAL